MRMQVILDSSFARPGSAPMWGGKKGEFRDWTNSHRGQKKFFFTSCGSLIPFTRANAQWVFHGCLIAL